MIMELKIPLKKGDITKENESIMSFFFISSSTLGLLKITKGESEECFCKGMPQSWGNAES